MEAPAFDLIESDPAVLQGKPCIKGTRLSVEFILELLATGATQAEILDGWPDLTAEAVAQALRFAASSMRSDVIIAVRPAS
jgi:uncharacterized protein (DUF433 family)